MSRRIILRVFRFLAVCCLSCGHAFTTAGEPAQETLTPSDKVYSCVFHVHSKVSAGGSYSLAELTALARRDGVDAIFLTDNLTSTIEYGLPPLRHVLRISYSRPSVMVTGPLAYLEMVETENRRQSDVLHVPGVEVCPRFYWTGSIKGKNLVCHNHQRNVIAVGTTNAAVLAGIPEARGYVWKEDPVWMAVSVIGPVLLLLLLLSAAGVSRFLSRTSPYSREDILRSYFLSIVLPLAVLVLATNGAASFMPSFDIYGEDNIARHEQRTIDFLRENGVAHYWAHPEAKDEQDFTCLNVPFKVRTAPYPEMLVKTGGYTGFGGVYEDINTLTDTNSLWDTVLAEYAAGRRKVPVWCFGEMLYHYEGQAGKKFGNVETMVSAAEKTAPALLRSLRDGRFYARNNSENQSLTLEEWKVQAAEQGFLDVSLSVASRAPGEKVRVLLIRNGQLAKDVDGVTPLRLDLHDSAPAGSGISYYRAVVTGAYPLKLVTNPLFVTAGAAAK